jgi:hypothetical protein
LWSGRQAGTGGPDDAQLGGGLILAVWSACGTEAVDEPPGGSVFRRASFVVTVTFFSRSVLFSFSVSVSLADLWALVGRWFAHGKKGRHIYFAMGPSNQLADRVVALLRSPAKPGPTEGRPSGG